ncbi:BLOC-2 complex member HPS6 [Pristis pectinata]|uniref:BLOC-2 complex member HPS6 n=1 Tax=Pristis pectinata TaxID=685728 RepID=UPI00223D1A60|nr:BLOC-2 complex member HPS6 [Pristis pectinata]
MPRSPPRRPSGLGPWRDLLPGARIRRGAAGGRLFLYLPRERRLLGLELEPEPRAGAGPLDRRLPPAEQLLEVLELGGGGPPTPGPVPVLLLTPLGRAELWVPAAAGWRLQRDFQLCHSPRARVLAAAWDGHSVTWCEERPSSQSRQYCVCSRSLGPGLAFDAARIVLHNSPACRLLAAGDAVYLLPGNAPGNGLSHGPGNSPIPGNCPGNGPIPSNCPSNYPSNSPIPGNYPGNIPIPGNCPSNSPSNSSIPGNCPHNSPVGDNRHGNNTRSCRTSNLDKLILIWRPQADTWTLASLARGPLLTKRLSPPDTDFRKLVADAVGLLPGLPTLDLWAVNTSPAGLLAAAAGNGEISLVRSDGTVRLLGPGPPAEALGERLLMELSGSTLAWALGRTVQLLDTETGRGEEETALECPTLALLSCRDTGELQALAEDGLYSLGPGFGPGGGLPRGPSYPDTLVLEEACDYYQKRSLGRSRLTVERLKGEAAFRAPAVLCSILRSRLGLSPRLGTGPQNQAKLLRALAGEVEDYAGLEQAKRRLVQAAEAEAAACVEEIARQEVARLLRLPPEPGTLQGLRCLSASYPAQAWRALSRALRLPEAQASPEQWKALLGPSPEQPAAFELTCGLMLRFQRGWLSGFVEQAQQQAAADGRCYQGPPLYKRALSVLPPTWKGPEPGDEVEAETAVELLLGSRRPNAVLQAVRLLLGRGLWSRAVEEAQRCSSGGGPLLRKELFAALLAELGRRRDLDPFLPDICQLCPADATAPELLQALMDALPPAEAQAPARPYPGARGRPLTLGLLRPLLTRVLVQAEERESGALAGEPPVFPPPAPPREKKAAGEAC